MSEGFKGFSNPSEDKKINLYIRNKEVNKIIKEYKKLKNIKSHLSLKLKNFQIKKQK